MSLDMQAPAATGLALRHACRACGSTDVVPLLPALSVPLYCNLLWPERAAAVDAPRGTLDLSACRECGHVDNRAFEPALLEYTPAYDNSLQFSAHFSGYAAALAGDLLAR